jgi:hypothetical protein
VTLNLEICRGFLDTYQSLVVVFDDAIGPRIAAQCWQDVFPTIISGSAFPWEDRKLKEETAGEASARRPGQGLARFVLDATWEGASQCAFCGFVLRTALRRPTPVGAMRPRDGRNF